MPSISVKMPYIANLTVNGCWRKGKQGQIYLRPEVATWRTILASTIHTGLDGSMLSGPLTVRIDWQGPQQPDMGNDSKVIWDAIQMATLINDREYVAEPGSYQRRPAREAEITVTISWGDDALRAVGARE